MGICKSLAKNAHSAITPLALALVLHPALFSNARRLEFLSSERGGGNGGGEAESAAMFSTQEARIGPIDSEARWMTAARGRQTAAGAGPTWLSPLDPGRSQQCVQACPVFSQLRNLCFS